MQEDVARLENAGIVGEQAEHGSHQEHFQIAAVVAGLFERVVQARDQLGRFDVDRVLVAERAALHADNESELLDVQRQVGKREAGFLALVPVEKLEGLEIAEKLIAGAVPLGQRVEVSAGLIAGGGQAAPGALLLDQEHARPEQVDEAGSAVEPSDVFLVARDGAPPDAEDIEEFVVETLGFALLVGGVRPLAGEFRCARPDFVPGKPHRRRRPGCVTPAASAVAWVSNKTSCYHGQAGRDAELRRASRSAPSSIPIEE